MKLLIALAATVLLLSGVTSLAAAEKARCAVCAVKGETELETVKATSTYADMTYSFCSKTCKEEFDADPVAYIPPEFPRPAPSTVVETLDGKDVALADLKGSVVLLDFWATWCKPCVKIMPEVQALYDRYRESGFTVAGVSIDEGDDRVSKITRFLDKYDITYPIYSDAADSPAWHAYRVKAVPAMFLIDRGGNIVAQWLGTVDHDSVAREVVKRLEEVD